MIQGVYKHHQRKLHKTVIPERNLDDKYLLGSQGRDAIVSEEQGAWNGIKHIGNVPVLEQERVSGGNGSRDQTIKVMLYDSMYTVHWI